MNLKVVLIILFTFFGVPILLGLLFRWLDRVFPRAMRIVYTFVRYALFSAAVGFAGLLFEGLLDGLNELLPRDWQLRSHDDHVWFVSAMTAGIVAYYVSRFRRQQHEEEKSKLIKNCASFIDSVRPAVEAGWKALDGEQQS